MANALVVASIVLLLISKIPDFVTTWRGIQRAGTVDWEQNPIARALFHKIGVWPSFGLLAMAYVVLVMLVGWVHIQSARWMWEWQLVGDLHTAEWVSATWVAVGACLISVTQLQAAIYNRTGRMHWPLRPIYRLLQWFYRR